MKIDRTKLKKSTSEVPAECKALIEKLKNCSDLHAELQHHKTWNQGKCELYHWVDVLDRFDAILEEGCKTEPDTAWHLACDHPSNAKLKQLIHSVLNFTALLIEHSFSRHLYNSIENLTTLLSSSDMSTVLAVLNLVYVFSKRSNFLIKLGGEKRQELFNRLTYLAESWGGKDNGFGLAECCVNGPNPKFPSSATTLHFEFYSETPNTADEKQTSKKPQPHTVTVIHIENVDKVASSPADIMEDLLRNYSIPKDKMTLLFTHIRLAHCFSNHEKRLQCVQTRLQAMSVLVYSSAIQEVSNSLLYNGLIEELVDVLHLQASVLVDIKAASLRTLTSIIHLDRNPKLVSIIDATGATSYHGFLPVLVRQCIQTMIDPAVEAFPHTLATALFSFLYHLASYETGGEALVSCGMMESLLKVIKWPGEDEQIHTTFVTRAVRVVDLITNLDMAAFQTHSGLSTFINRLEHEVGICRQEVPFVLRPAISSREGSMSPSHYSDDAVAMETDATESGPSTSREPGVTEEDEGGEDGGKDKRKKSESIQCFPQRAALLKSMLNFLKKAIPDPAFSDSIRHVMDGSLPRSLKHIISNAEYYGPSLFLLACELVTVYVFQEPSLLSSLQDTGLTDVMLHALLIKDVPATKEVLGSLPNIFSALCLNARGLQAFVQCKPFDKLFKVLLSPTYLPAMRRRRGAGTIGDTASSLGSAMDELMRHQPSLKADAMKAIIKLLEEINTLGRDPKYICSRQPSKSKSQASGGSAPSSSNNDNADDNTSSDDEEDEDEVASTVSQTSTSKAEAEAQQQSGTEVKTPVPLLDYILNVMKFVEAILSNNATDDHCREFVNQDGLTPLMGVLGLPNLPIDFPSSPACQSVANVCKSVLSLAHEPKVLKQGLVCLRTVLESLEPLHHPMDAPGGSILLKELVSAPNINEAPQSSQATPLLHAMASAHAYVTQFVHVCRVGQSDVRTISINQWGSPLGQNVLHGLSKLYTSLVWESIVLLALFTPGSLPEGCELGKAEKDKLLPKETPMEEGTTAKPGSSKTNESSSTSRTSNENRTSDADLSLVTSAALMDVGDALSPMEVDDAKGEGQSGKSKSKISPQMLQQLKQAMPVLYAPSRLGKALSELFGLLVKLCVGSSVRQRSRQHLQPNLSVPSEAARNTSKALTDLLATSLSWTPPPACPLPKFRLTFYICAVSFASPMLFDEKKNPYHLMLQKFVASGGHAALFEAFHWALSMGGKVSMKEGLQHPELPEGTGEFLDAWLVLVEKMVNPEAVLESPHCLPAKANNSPGFVPFSPAQFLINTHKAAFNAILNLWECKPLKVYGNRMSESILAILCHILRGESVIGERLEKEKNEAAEGTASGSGAAAGSSLSATTSGLGGSRFPGDSVLFGSGLLSRSMPRPSPNEEHVQQLIDMGFPREHAIEALQQTGTLEQAAEWALTHPPRISQDFGIGLTEEEEMMRAIAMSLGEPLQPTPDEQAKEEEKKRKEDEEKKRKEQEELQKQAAAKERIPEEPPLEKSVLDGFVESMLPGCLKLLDDIPDTVYRICDLLIVANNRSGDKWRDKMLEMLIAQIADHSMRLLQVASGNSSDGKEAKEAANKLSSGPDATKLAPRIHLFCLLFEEMKSACAKTVEASNLRDVLVRLLVESQQCLCAVKEAPTPKWLAPVLLLIDLYEKAAVTARRKLAQKGASHVWKWFDDSTGRWCQYSNNNNKTIDDAYWAGRTSVRFTAARRRYVVHFNTMVQINEETLNKRPIMQALPVTEKDINNKGEDKEEKRDSNKKLKTSSSTENAEAKEGAVTSASTSSQGGESSADKKETPKEPSVIPVEGLSSDHTTAIIRACVGLISIPVEPDTLHAVMRTCLRFTRDHRSALLFAELGGPQMLLHLTNASAFNGFPFLATLLLRHVFEERNILKHAMEKVISSTANRGVGSSMCGVTSGSMGARELHYVLRVLGPTACRDEQLFVDSAKALLKIALPVPKRGEDDDTRYTGPNALQLLKAAPLKFFSPPPIEGVMKQVLCDLLNALAVPNEPKPAEATTDTAKPANAEQKDTADNGDTTTEMDSSDTPATTDVAQVVAEAAPSGESSPAVHVATASEEIGMGLREIGDELLRFYTPVEGGRPGSGGQQPGVSMARPATQRLDSGPDAASAAEDEVHESSSPSTSVPPEAKKPPDIAANAKKGSSKQAKEEAAKAKPLVPKSAILRLVAELIRSYTGYALVVAQYQYVAGQTEYIREDGPVLAYVLDQLLPQCQSAGDKDCPALAQVLLASLAASNHSPEAQTILVAEVKAALARALALPEGAEKHARVQSLTLLIGVIIEACPPAGGSQHPSGTYKQPQPTTMNNIVRIMLRKGLVTDLARVPHSLDLSSPNMATTINSALKPLETLSRVVNQPMPTFGKGLGKGKTTITRSNGGGAGNSTSGAAASESSQGNTDILGVEPSRGANSQGDSQDPTAMEHRTELDDIMDELLERSSGSGPTVLGETLIATGPERLGSLGPGYLDQTGDASQDEMVITMTDEGEDMEQGIGDAEMNSHHSNEDGGDDGDEESVHDDDDSAADSESDDDSEDQQDDAEEEEDEDEEEEEEEHEEGSDMDADEYDYYDNLGESYFRVPDRDEDLFIQLEDVFPASIRTYQLPVAVHDDAANSNDVTGPSIPAAPGAVSTTHPLLIRHADHTNLTHGYGHTIRSHRGRTARGHRHGQSSTTQTVHIYHSGGNRTPSVPTILRLLGLTSAADLVQLTGGSSGGGGGGSSNTTHGQSNQTRVFVTDSVEDHLFGQNYDSIYNDLYQDNFNEGWVSATDPISSVPSAYSRWAEEARVLDGGSVHDCIQALKPEIITVLEKIRDEELADRREKRKKQAEEEAKKKAAEEVKKKAEEEKKKEEAAAKKSQAEAKEGESSNAETKEQEKDKEEMMEVVEGSQRSSEDPPAGGHTSGEAAAASQPPTTTAPDVFSNVSELAASVAATAMGSLTATSPAIPATSTPTTTPTMQSTPQSTPPGPATGLAAAIASIVASPPVASAEVISEAMQGAPAPGSESTIASVGGNAPGPRTSTPTPPISATSSTAPTTSSVQSGPAVTTPSEAGGLAGFTTPALRAFSEANPTFASLLAQDLSEVGLQSSPASSNQDAGPQAPTGAAPTTTAANASETPTTEANANTQSASSLNNVNLPSQSTPGTSSGDVGGVQLPEGVDPSFLAALPENIRQEVLREHLGIRNTQTPPVSSTPAPTSTVQTTTTTTSSSSTTTTTTNPADPNSSISQVNPEFLAALPPHIQEEVLAQERAEQQRLLATQQPATQSAEPVDPAAFIQNLPPGLRQTVLADMDDTVLAVLPSEIAAEAQALRLDRVLRHRQLMQERLLRETGMLSAILLQSSGMQGRLGHGVNYYRLSVPRGQSGSMWGWGNPRGSTLRSSNPTVVQGSNFQGRQLVDLEALTCLLVLLFVNEPKLNTARLHRVLRNLSYHGTTRQWILQALLSILERTSLCKSAIETGESRTGSQSRETDNGLQVQTASSSVVKSQPSWLSISMEAALGCRANVFQVQRGSKKSSERQGSLVCIHPQAAPLVCRHALDTLVSLAKVFPYQFVPQKAKDASSCDTAEGKSQDTGGGSQQSQSDSSELSSSQSSTKSSSAISKLDMDFWDLLVRLDSTSQGRKGKAASKPPSATSTERDNPSFSSGPSPLASLMAMLSHPVVRRSTTLTDRLLHLLSLVSASLPDKDKAEQAAQLAGSATAAASSARQAGAATRQVQAPQATTASREATNLSTQESSQPSTPAVTASQTSQPPIEAPAASLPIEQAVSPMVEGSTSSGSTNGASPMDTASADAEASDTQIIEETSKESEEKTTPKTEEENKTEKTVVEEQLLELAVEVLTAHSCSEDGLEDATTLLMQLSRGHGATREAVLRLLLAGAQQLGRTLCSDIKKLLTEVQDYQSKHGNSNSPETEEPSTSSGSGAAPPSHGVLADRFNQGANIVVTGNSKGSGRGGFELRLPSMSLFTSKMSNQNLFLRMLKVVIQLREAARKAAKRATETQRQLTGTANLAAAVAALEAGASELMEMVNRRGEERREREAAQRSVAPATGEALAFLPPPPVSAPSGSSAPATTPVTASSIAPSTNQPPAVASAAASESSGESSTTSTSGSTSSATVTPSSSSAETPMEVDQPQGSQRMEGGTQAGSSQAQVATVREEVKEAPTTDQPRLSSYLGLEELWETLSACLTHLSHTPDHHAVLVLQPAVEAFFLVHASEKDTHKPSDTQLAARDSHAAHLGEAATPLSPMPSTPASALTTSMSGFFARESSVASIVTASMPPDTQKFLRFAETHRDVLNQILRQSTVHLSEGPFSVLVNHTRILDFDVKRRYFRQELERMDEGMRREDMAIHIRREHVFEDSYRELHRRSAEEWKNRFYVVFEGEEGQDAGGLLREWYLIISKEIFNQMYALFKISPGDRVTYIPNPASHCNSNHLSYFKFVGRIIAKAIYDNKLLECYFSRSFYKHILGKHVKYTDMESEDYPFYQGLVFLLEHDVSELGYELTFSTDIEEFGVTDVRDLKPNGRNIPVTEQNKAEYVSLVCQMKMTGAIRKQIDSFLEGFYDIIPKKLISIFNEQELELLLAGLPSIDVDELKANTEYHKYQSNSLQIQWFWRALRSFDQALRAKFLQFVTGTSKVPLQGFASLEGMNGPQKFQIHRDDRSTDRLPTAHTCFNQLDLPAYETYDKLRNMLLLAIEECTEGFGLA